MSPILLLCIILAYFGLLLFVAYKTGKNSDNESFFIGNRKSNWMLVAFGMIGTSLSGITFVSVPGAVGKFPKENLAEKEVKVGDAIITQAPQFQEPEKVEEDLEIEAHEETKKEPADFFCDFDEPEGKPVTDADLYPAEVKKDI